MVGGLPRDRQRALVHQVALEAVRTTGSSAPPEWTDLQEWAAELDARGWSVDADGEWSQAEGDFARARAAFALRDAAYAGEGTDSAAIEDSLYESIAARGVDVIRRQLGLTP